MAYLNIDMDGVLADFDKHYQVVTGTDFHSEVPSQERWNRLKGSEAKFYSDMPAYPGYFSFLEEISKLIENTLWTPRYLSAKPSLLEVPDIERQKLAWLYNKVPILSEDWPLVMAESSSEKCKFCEAGDILIDDNPRNVAQWMKRGGIAIRHLSFHDSLVQLRELL